MTATCLEDYTFVRYAAARCHRPTRPGAWQLRGLCAGTVLTLQRIEPAPVRWLVPGLGKSGARPVSHRAGPTADAEVAKKRFV